MSKICSRCGKEKDVEEFARNSSKRDGLSSYCRACQGEYMRSWSEKNQEKVSLRSMNWRSRDRLKHNEAQRKWRSKNRDKCKIAHDKWASANPEKAREANRTSSARRRKDPKYKLSNSISVGILQSIRKGTKAKRHWEELVGFTAEQLKSHIEKLFEPGMNWGNYGRMWEIDHKVPISIFNFTRPEDIDFRRCWALKNLQPMEVKRNRSKRDSIEEPFQPSLALRVAKRGCHG